MEHADFLVEPMRARVRSATELAALFAGGWPVFIDCDAEAARSLPRIRQLFADRELALLDPVTQEVVAAGWAVPIRWDGKAAALPAGYSDSLVRALADRDAGAVVDIAVLCAAQVRPDHARTGVAGRLLQAMIQTASTRGLIRFIAPLRPTGQHLHPLVPIDEYVAWTRPDGSAHDPWLRTHLALGGRVLATAPASQVFTAPASSWRNWSGLAMPTSGSYPVPDALAPVVVNVESDLGTLTEPCIWVQHR